MSEIHRFMDAISTGNYPVIVITTLREDANDEWIQSLVSDRLAVCITKLPGAKSTFRWKGELVTDTETVCLIKTTSERLPALVSAIEKMHPYEVPEIAVLKVSDLNESYWSWLRDSTTEK